MERYEALELIKGMWNDSNIDLGTKIIEISTAFYTVGLDISTTAAFIKATPSELDALLSLGALDEEIIKDIAEVEPPKTTWSLIANASDDEIRQALGALSRAKDSQDKKGTPLSEYVYQQMLEVAGPTVEQMVGMLPGGDLAHAHKKGMDFGALNDWENKFLKSIAAQKKSGKTLSRKQIHNLIKVLDNIVAKGAIKRNSIDGDEEICNRILDAMGK